MLLLAEMFLSLASEGQRLKKSRRFTVHSYPSASGEKHTSFLFHSINVVHMWLDFHVTKHLNAPVTLNWRISSVRTGDDMK